MDFAREEDDVAIRVGALPDSDLIARKLGRIMLSPCASAAYLAARGTPETPETLMDHELLGWQDRPGEWWFTDDGGRRHAVAVTPKIVAPEAAVLVVVLAGSVGIGRLPDFSSRPLVERGELIRLLPGSRPRAWGARVYPAHRSLSARVRVFVDALVVHLADAA